MSLVQSNNGNNHFDKNRLQHTLRLHENVENVDEEIDQFCLTNSLIDQSHLQDQCTKTTKKHNYFQLLSDSLFWFQSKERGWRSNGPSWFLYQKYL